MSPWWPSLPQAGGIPPDPKAAFKAEWEALEVEQLFTCNVLTPSFPAGYWAHLGPEELRPGDDEPGGAHGGAPLPPEVVDGSS